MSGELTGALVAVRYTPNAEASRRPRDGAGNELASQTVQVYKQVTLTVTAPTNGGYVTGTDGLGTTVIECGSGARTDCTETMDSGSVLTLTATPDGGYVFGGWSGGCTGSESSCSVTVNDDVGVTGDVRSGAHVDGDRAEQRHGDGPPIRGVSKSSRAAATAAPRSSTGRR